MGLIAVAGALAIAGRVGPSRAWAVIGAAFFSTALGVMAVVLLDRFEPEPRRVTVFVFAFGATIAVALSLIVHAPVSALLLLILGSLPRDFIGSVLVAPLTEEFAKGVAVYGVFLLMRDEFNGVIDGMVYASMVALGFAFAENTLYYSDAIMRGTDDFVALVFVRGGMSGFSHPLFTSMTGIGLAMAARRGARGLPWALGGLVGAIALHATWNGATISGTALPVYLVVFLPLLTVVLIAARLAMRNEAAVIRRFVAKDVELGLLTRDELDEVGSPTRRRQVMRDAYAWGGSKARDARRVFHTAVLDLAFHRHHRYPGEPDPAVEYPLVCEIARYKRSLNPGWVTPAGVDID